MNRLKNQKSPYLLQHAKNPVDWYPWGEEAFLKAQKENKPIFLSIGYSTCHWCHVMAHESFEDQSVADVLNRYFISIKVDREERPDIDSLYMMVCQMMTGHGGWPLTIFMSPDKKPFFAGTYFPKSSQHGRIGLVDLLLRIHEVWMTQQKEIQVTMQSLETALESLHTQTTTTSNISFVNLIQKCQKELEEIYDEENGGFGFQPKFPSPQKILFLLDDYKYTKNQKSLDMAEKTLFEMHRGGIFDHIAGGFHRYSTDSKWELPHFEKMLYDQAWISYAYVSAYELTQNIFYKNVANQILQCVEDDFFLKEGALASSFDADSEGEEGLFYVWSLEELKKNLTQEEWQLLDEKFLIYQDGNYFDEATHQKTGKNILFLKKSLQSASQEEIANEFNQFEFLRKKLKKIRDQKTKLHRDEKILTDWNCQMAASLFKAGRVLNEKKWIELGTKVLNFIDTELRLNDSLFHRICDGELLKYEFLDDHVSWVWALMHAFEATKDKKYLKKLEPHIQKIERAYKAQESGGYFLTAVDQEKLLTRMRELYDGAMPSANSIYMASLMKLSMYLKRPDMQRIFEQNIEKLSTTYLQSPSSYSFAMLACYFYLHPHCDKDLCP